MKLELYQNTSDTKRIGKTLALVETLDPIFLKEGTDLLHPVFTFHKRHYPHNQSLLYRIFVRVVCQLSI
jgi:hypothetical protein